jgi:hypothetical protein
MDQQKFEIAYIMSGNESEFMRYELEDSRTNGVRHIFHDNR